MKIPDAVLRLLGADPGTFRPVYRVQKLILGRRGRLVQSSRRRASSPFRLLCFFAVMYGISGAALVAASKSSVLGGAAALVFGCSFLLLVVITDHFDVLVNPREALILAAHPHDDRSILLAKVAAIGRVLALLGAFLFIPPAIAAGMVMSSLPACAAYLAGAAGAGAATSLVGLLTAALLVRTGGRTTLDRMMPWLQGVFQIGYLAVIGGSRLMEALTRESVAEVGAWAWALPVFWFLAPLELAAGGPWAPAAGRLALAAGSLGLLLGGATRWLGTGLTGRLLEPEAARERRPQRAARPRRVWRAGGSERGRLFAMLRVHMRSDWRTRSEFLLTPLLGFFLLAVYVPSQGGPGGSATAFFYSWLLVLSADALTRSHRPGMLWFILASPVERTRFSLATLSMSRAFHLAPLFAAAVFAEVRAGGAPLRTAALLVELLLLGDLLVILGKGIFPDFPFSRPREAGAGGSRVGLVLVSGLASGVAGGLVLLSGVFGPPGLLTGAALFAILRFPVGVWARRRAAEAADRVELVA